MRVRELEQWLSQVDGFEEPKMEREQYVTSAHIAARLLVEIQESWFAPSHYVASLRHASRSNPPCSPKTCPSTFGWLGCFLRHRSTGGSIANVLRC